MRMYACVRVRALASAFVNAYVRAHMFKCMCACISCPVKREMIVSTVVLTRRVEPVDREPADADTVLIIEHLKPAACWTSLVPTTHAHGKQTRVSRHIHVSLMLNRCLPSAVSITGMLITKHTTTRV